MKTMILTTSIVVFVAICNISNAQSRLPPGQINETAATKLAGYKTRLGLSADQSIKVEVIDSVYIKNLESLKETPGSKLERYRKFKEIGSERDRELKEVLNKEQFKQFQQIKTEIKKELKSNRSNN